MKKTLLFLALTVGFCFNSICQNIIPNPDWELGPTVSTDYTTGWTVNGPASWTTTQTSPDRIYAGSFASYRDNDPAQSGSAYVMFYGPYNEAGKCTLTSPVVAGVSYNLSYWLDVDNNFDGGPGAIKFNFIGGDTITSPYVSNTGSWQHFTRSFTATLNATELELIGEGQNLTKIDNMLLQISSPNAVNELGTTSDELGVYPNPSTGIFTVSSTKYQVQSIKIINIFGDIIYQSTINNQQSKIDLSKEAKGIYFVQIQTESKNIITKKIIIQ